MGMGSAHNVGLKHIKTDYAFILNPDVISKKNTIEEIIIASKKIDNFGLIAPISDNLKYPNYKTGKKSDLHNFIDPFKVESVDGFAMILNLKKLRK